MADESDEEMEMIMNQKSRYTLYRKRIREEKKLYIAESITLDDPTSSPYAFFNIFSRFLYVGLKH